MVLRWTACACDWRREDIKRPTLTKDPKMLQACPAELNQPPQPASIPELNPPGIIPSQLFNMAQEAEAVAYLTSLLNRTLHLHTSDGRLFVGQLKCTDNERNIILAMTHEYRQPSKTDIQLAAERHERMGGLGDVKVGMKKRFVGLVVVPGTHITKIEMESYA